MMASTSARVASAQTSPARAVHVAAGDPVGLAAVPAGDDVAVPVGDAVVAVVAVVVGEGDAVPVVDGAVGVGDAPEVPPGVHAVSNTRRKRIGAINEVLMRYT